MYEMWKRKRKRKRKQTHEDARQMHLTKTLVKKVGKNGEGVVCEVMTWSEEWTDKEKS